MFIAALGSKSPRVLSKLFFSLYKNSPASTLTALNSFTMNLQFTKIEYAEKEQETSKTKI